jgi:hypothetical protein
MTTDQHRLIKPTGITLIMATLIFTIVYAQSPLYTSNQNQYFLHGFANAGIGNLGEDWLANTLDPTPIFSLLVEYTLRVFMSEVLFYIYFACLLGIYLYSVFGIIDLQLNLRGSRIKTIAFFSIFLLLHAAATRYSLSTIINPDWAYLFEGGVANQRLLGTVLQPSIFGVLLVLSIYQFLQGQAIIAIFTLALSATLHPTYLLTAAILTVTYMGITYQEERKFAKSLGIGLFALILVLPILIYTYFTFAATTPEASTRARELLVNFRIPHHAVISQWWNFSVLLDIIFIAIALYLTRYTKLFTILLTCTVVGILITFAQLSTQNNALALIFPWRISVILVPLSTSIIAAYLISTIIDRFASRWTWLNPSIQAMSILLIALLFIAGVSRMLIDFSTKYSLNDQEMLSFIKNNKTSGDVYLVPTKMQDFRLVTSAPIYIDFKSIPYRDKDVLEWYRRQRLAGKFYRTQDCDLLRELSIEDGVTHLVLEKNINDPSCSFLDEIYRDDHYKVFAISLP